MKKKVTSATIIEWLRNHELINISRLERRCDISQGLLSKCMKDTINNATGETWKLPQKHIENIVSALRDYGF